ncbi:hypothetical protein FZC37_01450 [Candidatus Sneabacter namystus]|uniref:MFS transporter n=2 Tax=Candidatus Sneabacter namystus TaxID=2601646 RepID=A0A5C0UII1_9RICK|nr:hypothetical protein FZC37_01450 [Candidatus Sneabacter namystus]
MYTDNIHRDVLLKFWPLLLLPEGLGVLLAALIKKEPENQRQNTGSLFLVLQKIKKNFTLFIQICILHSFDHFTYYFAFVFINSFIPMLTGKITYSCMLKYNAAFMIFDLLLSIALIQYKKSITLVKKISAILPFCICICCIALVPLTMATHSIFIVLVIRMLIVFMGTICSCMFCNLAFQKSKKISEDTTFVGFSFSYLIGSTLGKNFTPAAFFLFETTQNPYSPIMLSCLICVISGICAFYLNKK